MQRSVISRSLTNTALGLMVVVLLGVVAGQVFDWYRFVPVLSGSMSGHVEAGDVAVMRPLDAAELASGEVIAFNAPVPGEPLTLHRVIEVVEPGDRPLIRTKGDANTVADPWTARIEDPTVWRMTERIPVLGRPVLWMQRLHVRMVLLVIAVALVLRIGLVAIWSRPDPVGVVADVEPETLDDPSVAGPARRALVGVPLVVLLALAATVAASHLARPASASFTDATAARHTVSSWSSGAPTGLAAAVRCSKKAGLEGVDLTWSAPAGATPSEHVVYRSATSGGTRTEIARVAGTAHTDLPPTGDAGAWYVVSAVVDGVESEASSELFVDTSCRVAPGQQR